VCASGRSAHDYPMALPQASNQHCSLDFVSAVLGNEQRFRVPAAVGGLSGACLTLVVDTSPSGLRVGRELDRIAELRGCPVRVASDNGAELTSHAMPHWQKDGAVLWPRSRSARQAAGELQ
jgi:putative transposase